MIGLHGLFYVLPILTFASWTTAIVGLLGLWAHDRFVEYEVEEASVVFISDVGASHKTFFIIFCCLTAAFYMMTTLAERHLRHKGKIPGSIRKKQTYLDIASVVCAFIGSIALIMLSIFDAFNHSNVHWSMTLIFVVFVALSVLFQVLQIYSLSHDYNRLATLKAMAILKTIILSFAIAGAIAFVVCYGICRGDALPGNNRCDKVVSAAAVCEWAIAFILDIFFLTYIIDLWPAHHYAKHGLSEDGTMVENKQLAREQGTLNRPIAANAIDGVQNNNTYYPSQAGQEYQAAHPNQHNYNTYPNAQPTGATHVNTMPNSERGSLHQPPMTEAR